MYRSIEGCARKRPDSPPVTNSETNPSAKSIDVLNWIFPPHSVPSQLNVLMADGTPMAMVSSENANAEYGLNPLMNMWWPQTMKPRKPMDDMAATMALYPNTGLRANVERMCDATPMPGRMAIYTSGCPKNQNRCCHSSGEPPLWSVTGVSVSTSPPGIKKLVPAVRSSSSRTQAASSTPNDSRLRMAVISQAHTVSGMRDKVMPLARRSRVVVMKFSAPSSAAMQKIPTPTTHSVCPAPCPGPAISPSALNGG